MTQSEPQPLSATSPIAFLAVVTTVESQPEAQHMARTLVERGLAACAQISAIESFYTWDGAVQHAQEFRVLFKTTRARYAALEQAIRELHTYELPAIHACAIEEIYAPYAAWVEGHCQGTRST
jgi:periplasmic divalent cation tolerance protein